MSEIKVNSLVAWLAIVGLLSGSAWGAGPGGGSEEGNLPPVGSDGGPRRLLNAYETRRWLAGRESFSRKFAAADGLGAPRFNAESCGACHKDPVLGGAGGIEANVFVDEGMDSGARYLNPLANDRNSVRKARLTKFERQKDSRSRAAMLRGSVQTPSVLGLGLIDTIYEDAILAREDLGDADRNGVRGIAGRVEVGGRTKIGRFGWKAQLPSLHDFVRAACGGELGVTVPDDGTGFGLFNDNDAAPDPELFPDAIDDLVFFCSELAPPRRGGRALEADVRSGERLFDMIGCTACHVPQMCGREGPVDLYSDLLLHDVVKHRRMGCDEPEADDETPVLFRTPPLWGIGKTAPYLHDGRALTLEGAIAGHHSEGTGARRGFEELPHEDRAALITFLQDL